MAQTWKKISAAEVLPGNRIKTDKGEELTVTRIESAFFGREGMLAFIEDTPERWYKRPLQDTAEVEVVVESD